MKFYLLEEGAKEDLIPYFEFNTEDLLEGWEDEANYLRRKIIKANLYIDKCLEFYKHESEAPFAFRKNMISKLTNIKNILEEERDGL